MTTGTGTQYQATGTASPGHGWRAVSIVLVGAFMALLDKSLRSFNG